MFKAMPMFSGSSGNCVYIKYGEDEVLIDAGVSFKNIRTALMKLGTDIANIKAVFVTHEHSDHIKGLEVMCKHFPVPVYINSASLSGMNLPEDSALAKSVEIANASEHITVGEIDVDIFQTPHDSNGSVGYRFNFSDGKAFGYATDIGHITDDIKRGLFGCESVVFESNHDVNMLKNGPYPYILKKRILSENGHLSNDACAQFLPQLIDKGTKKVVLAHLSAENNTPELCYKTSAQALTAAGYTPDDVRLSVAMRSIL